jgi:PLP dependent protein
MTTSPISSSSSEFEARVASNLELIRSRIADCGRDVDSVSIVAVTKTFAADAVTAAVNCGISSAGENYVNELVAKHQELEWLTVSWQFLGHIQSNKISKILKNADVVAGVSRVVELEAFAQRDAKNTLYLQVDFTNSAGRNGATPEEIPELASVARSLGLRLTGLMTVPPIDPREAQNAFQTLGALADRLELPVRSMGMSDDFEAACRLGATEIRLGRALFGARNP